MHLVGKVVAAASVVLEFVLQAGDDAVLLLQLPHHVLSNRMQHGICKLRCEVRLIMRGEPGGG
jgi:hypothetical protein